MAEAGTAGILALQFLMIAFSIEEAGGNQRYPIGGSGQRQVWRQSPEAPLS
jgi:hypothetical protein